MGSRFGEAIVRLGLGVTLLAALWVTPRGVSSPMLEAYFAASGMPRPPFSWQHTANWRGYVAEWAVEDDRLCLTGLTGRIGDAAVTLEALFPGQERVPATWVSGRLRVALGELVRHEHMGYESVYDRELGLYVERGRIMLRTLVVNEP